MTQYATLKDLIQRTDGDEVVQRGLSSLRLVYRQAVATQAALTDIDDPRLDDAALVEEDGLLYRYDGDAWASISTPKVDDALLDAGALADSYLRGRYSLPLDGIPRELVQATCDIARYNLYDDGAPESIAQRHKDALAWLKAVSQGTATLDATAASQPEGGRGSVNISGPGRVFSRDSMESF